MSRYPASPNHISAPTTRSSTPDLAPTISQDDTGRPLRLAPHVKSYSSPKSSEAEMGRFESKISRQTSGLAEKRKRSPGPGMMPKTGSPWLASDHQTLSGNRTISPVEGPSNGWDARPAGDEYYGNGYEAPRPDYGQLPAAGFTSVEQEVNQLRANLNELISLLQPFAPSAQQPRPPPPPLYLTTRFTRLSSSVHQSLSSLAPHLHTNLAPGFIPSFIPPATLLAPATITPTASTAKEPDPESSTEAQTRRKRVEVQAEEHNLDQARLEEEMSQAEREMEVIRKRRDILIARAQAAAAAGHNSVGGRPNSKLRPPATSSYSVRNGMNGSPGLGNFSALSEASEIASSRLLQHRGLGEDGPITAKSLSWVGRCHGCGIGVRDGWREGPDGPDTLCESCGGHYERLTRKKVVEPYRDSATESSA
ncbi:hypothetical protein I350_00197 [Cryptococcus amylolentus CBS 6273]|uniref:GATA-type domain-containing protein n=1 Tax=Cryptococcus amylolentus CBS 6273 TaxID=1296118 RepID=A0A1E3KFQ5_9TREE|nr:hypothetical protein I350_00197 [Cryptococcus amylolentus CBS 6273]